MKTFTLIVAILAALAFCYPNSAGAQSASSRKDSLVRIDSANTAGHTFTKVETESEFPGGTKAWLNFLNTHLTYPKKAVRKKIEGTVILQFIVDKDGTVTDLQALTGDPILREAALKAMADSPKWIPAMQNGRIVKSYKKQPVVFKLQP
ncbi:MAG TPA: energy transducer TonB [Puia sp.]|nr:energy transducer TonB [Puia sp.]